MLIMARMMSGQNDRVGCNNLSTRSRRQGGSIEDLLRMQRPVSNELIMLQIQSDRDPQ